MAIAYVQPEQTLTIKGVHKSILTRMREGIVRESNPKLGITHVPDKDPSCAGQFLVYANYDSGRECLASRDKLKQWAADKWPDKHLTIMRKSDMAAPAFAVYVCNAPPGTPKEEMAKFFSQFGPLHPCTPVACIKDSDNAFFINFERFEGAVAVLAEARGRALRFEGSVMVANAGRNTTFINDLIASLQNKGSFSFSEEEALAVRNKMSTQDWPPKAGDVAKLVKAVPERFVIDRTTKQYHLIDPDAALAPVGYSIADRRARVEQVADEMVGEEGLRRTSPGIRVDVVSPELEICDAEESDRKLRDRKKAVDELVHENFELLHALFEYLWGEAKGRPWEDSRGGMASSSAMTLLEEMYMQELPPNMLEPVGDWDLSTLCNALMAKSLKDKLAELSPRASPRGGREVSGSGDGGARFKVLVDDKIVALADMEDKYASCFEAAKWRAPQALQTIRFVRNILSHQKGCVKGLSQKSFDVLWSVTTAAFETLARVVRPSRPHAVQRFEERRKKIEEALQDAERCRSPDGSRPGSPLSSRSSSEESSASECSSEVSSECDVKGWSQEQVVSFFEDKGFPTEGIKAGKIDGGALLELLHADDAMELFTAPVPDGMGFNKLMYRGRFKSEMAKLEEAHMTVVY